MLKERISPSLGSKLLDLPLERVAHEIAQPFKPSPEMERGNRWEALIRDPSAVRPQFAGTATRGAKFETWVEQQPTERYMCETKSEAEETNAFLSTMTGYSELIASLNSCTYQDHLEGEGVHCFTDFMNRDDKIIYEMKVLRDSHKFNDICIRSHYDLQAYIQVMLAGAGFELYWLTIDSKAPHSPRLWRATPEVIESGRQKYLIVEDRFKRLNAGDFGPSADYTEDVTVPTWRLNQLC